MWFCFFKECSWYMGEVCIYYTEVTTLLLWINVNWPDIWPPKTSGFQPQPVLLSQLFCNSWGSNWQWSIRLSSCEAEIGIEDRMDGGLPLSLPTCGSSQVTLCESVRLYVAGKSSFGGCGFRSGCPVVAVCSCDTVNHAAITHAHRRFHGHGTQTHTQTCVCE